MSMRLKFNRKIYLQVLGRNLRAFRLLRKVDIEVVAREVKISPAELNMIEEGRKDIEVVKLIDLCLLYGIDPDDAFRGMP